MEEYIKKQREWSKKTFGDGPRTLALIKHIESELNEIFNEPYNLTEWLDVVILALDGYWRHGGKPEELISMLKALQERNIGRVYPMPESDDEPSYHV